MIKDPLGDRRTNAGDAPKLARVLQSSVWDESRCHRLWHHVVQSPPNRPSVEFWLPRRHQVRCRGRSWPPEGGACAPRSGRHGCPPGKHAAHTPPGDRRRALLQCGDRDADARAPSAICGGAAAAARSASSPGPAGARLRRRRAAGRPAERGRPTGDRSTTHPPDSEFDGAPPAPKLRVFRWSCVRGSRADLGKLGKRSAKDVEPPSESNATRTRRAMAPASKPEAPIVRGGPPLRSAGMRPRAAPIDPSPAGPHRSGPHRYIPKASGAAT